MKKSKDILYNDLQKFVKGKDDAVTAYVNNFLNKLQSMFVYTGAPDTLNVQAMERELMTTGNVAIAEVDGDLYALSGSTGGELDAYYQPTTYIVANPWLKLTKEYTIGKDCVLMRNDYNMVGLMPIIGRYAVQLTDTEISLNTVAVMSRISMLISASDDKTKTSADLFVSKILNGDFSVIGESAFLDGVKLQTLPNSGSNYITQLIELLQYYKASFYNEIGLNANFNMKRERVTTNELQVNVDALLPLADEMLRERQIAIENVNAMFGTEISVDFGSAWKTIHEEEELNNEMVETNGNEHEPPSEPQEPSEPSEPQEPSEPSEPQEPSEPSATQEPQEPSEAQEPQEPKEKDDENI